MTRIRPGTRWTKDIVRHAASKPAATVEDNKESTSRMPEGNADAVQEKAIWGKWIPNRPKSCCDRDPTSGGSSHFDGPRAKGDLRDRSRRFTTYFRRCSPKLELLGIGFRRMDIESHHQATQ